jgi:glucose-6-phosphate-specific signal transduction histidine kinase
MKNKKSLLFLKLFLIFLISSIAGTFTYYILFKELKPITFIISSIPIVLLAYSNIKKRYSNNN